MDKKLSLLFPILFLICISIKAQNASIFELIAEYDNNVLGNWIDVQDDLAYITTLNGLSVINICDPYNPLFVGDAAIGGSWQIDVNNEYAYFLAGGVKFVNISQPGNYQLSLTYPNSNYSNIKAKGNYLYLTKLQQGFDIIDVSVPTNPVEIYDFNEPGIYSEEWAGYSHIDVSGNFLYVAESENEILIFDISNINNPQKIYSIPTTQFITDLVVDNNLLFIGTFEDLKIYNISNPASPVFLSIINEVDRPSHINIQDGIIVFYDDNIYRYYAIDISDPASPTIMGYYDTVSHGIYFDGEYIYAVGPTFKIYILNLTTDITNSGDLSFQFELYPNFPNPFNPVTKIKYSIPSLGITGYVRVQIIVFDILGNEIITLVDDEHVPGEYSVDFHAAGLASGIYLYHMETSNGITLTKKLVVQK